MKHPGVLVFLLINSLIIFSVMDTKKRRELCLSKGWLSFLFLFSGFAALIYQIIWHRVLFTIYHWHDHGTQTLSKEFLTLCREHLKPAAGEPPG